MGRFTVEVVNHVPLAPRLQPLSREGSGEKRWRSPSRY
jgi:hypothetical protein